MIIRRGQPHQHPVTPLQHLCYKNISLLQIFFSFSFPVLHRINQTPKVQCPNLISWTCLAQESGLVDCGIWWQNYKDWFRSLKRITYWFPGRLRVPFVEVRYMLCQGDFCPKRWISTSVKGKVAQHLITTLKVYKIHFPRYQNQLMSTSSASFRPSLMCL